MMHRIAGAALLALLGASSTLSAQVTEGRERETGRRVDRIFNTLMRGPRIGVTVAGARRGDTLGLRVDRVVEGGPADRAGIREGDRLTAVNGINLRVAAVDADDEEMQRIVARRLTRELEKVEVGDEVELRYTRSGESRTAKVKTVDASELVSGRVAAAGMLGDRGDRASLGIGFGGSASRRDTLGVFVSSITVDGPAEKAGIEEGDRISAINGVDLRVAAEDAGDMNASFARVRRLHRELERVKAGDEVELRLYRAGAARTVRVRTAAARDLRGGYGIYIGGGDGWRIGALGAPMPPLPPLPPGGGTAPRMYYFDSDGGASGTIRMSPRFRTELRERSRDAIDRALELRESIRPRIRLEMDNMFDDVTTTPARPPAVRSRATAI